MKLQVVSALDKQRYIRRLREEASNRPNNVCDLSLPAFVLLRLAHHFTSSLFPMQRVMYVGDAINDVLALLEVHSADSLAGEYGASH
jgi:hypothetical protein